MIDLLREFREFNGVEKLWFLLIFLLVFVGGVAVLFSLKYILKGLKLQVGDKKFEIPSDEIVQKIETNQEALYNKQLQTLEKTSQATDEANSTLHFMNMSNQENDDHLKQKCLDRVTNMRNRIRNDLSGIITDRLATMTICIIIHSVFQKTIIRNRFTKELMLDKIERYRFRILDDIRQEYIQIQHYDERIPKIDAVDDVLSSFVDSWFSAMKEEVTICCEEKIKVYESYLSSFESVPYIKKIVVSCVEKNTEYIRQLKIDRRPLI